MMNNSTITYSLAWVTKRRKPFLKDEIGLKCMRRISAACNQRGWHIYDLNFHSDHIYVEVQTPASLSPHEVVAHLKHETALGLRKRYRALRRLPSVWTRKYLVLANGYSEQAVQDFIKQQPKV